MKFDSNAGCDAALSSCRPRSQHNQHLSPEAVLKAAINREVIDGDITGAIQQYKEIATKYASNHAVAAGRCFVWAGCTRSRATPERAAAYQRIVNEYADAGATVMAARARLAGLQESAFPFKSRDVSSYFAGALFNKNSWSPDGKYVMYQKPTLDGLLLKEAATGKQVSIGVRPTETTLGFVWAPNSQSVVVTVRMSREQVEFRTISVQRGETQVIASSPARAGVSFAWSPDSRKLAFLSGSAKGDTAFPEVQVVTFSPKPSAPANLGSLDTNSSVVILWAPDGSRVAFMAPPPGSGRAPIRVVDVNTQQTQTIETPSGEPNSRIQLFTWTPANQIFFKQSVTNGADGYLVDAAGGTPRKICENRFDGDGCQRLSPDGTLLVTRQNVTGGGRIALRNTETGQDRLLTNEAVMEQTINFNGPSGTSGSFSPDGRLFVFFSNRDGKNGMYVVPVDQIPVANPLRIGNLSEGRLSGRWTGNHLVFALEESPTNIFRIDLDPQTGQPSGPVVRLTQDTAGNNQPYISPDGRRIAYASRWQSPGGHRGFYLMDANGQRERLVHQVAPDRLTRMTLVGWRSNDELLISDLGAAPLARGGSARTLMVLNLTTNELRAAGTPPPDRRGRVFDKAPVLESPPAGVEFDWSTANKSPDGFFVVLEGSTAQVKWQRIENITYDAVVKLTSGKK